MKIINSINELDADTRRLALYFLQICKIKGYDVRIFETYRTQARQNALWNQGRTDNGRIVTYTRKSFHTTRRAFDVIKNTKTNQWDDSDGFFGKIAEIGRDLGLNCGYYWKGFQDKPHFQLDYGKKGISGANFELYKTRLLSECNSSQKEQDGLKKALKSAYGLSDSTINYLATYKYATELMRKLVAKEPLSGATKQFVLEYKFGEEVMRRVYGV